MLTHARLFGGLARILEAAAREARAIADECEDRGGWIDQSTSPLGPRRHCAAVRRRMEAGLEGAGRAGRRFLLSPSALAEELGRPVQSDSIDTQLTRDLRLAGGL